MKKRKREHRLFSMLRSTTRDAAQSIERNNLMSIASVLSVVAALIILGIFFVFTMNLHHITNTIESSLELRVYLVSGYTEQQRTEVESALAADPRVLSLSFESEDEALTKFADSLENYSGLLSGYNSENNPMQASYVIQVDSAENLSEVRNYAEGLTNIGVDSVEYGEEMVNVMIDFSRVSNTACIIVTIVLTVISFFIIYNTIKLTCFARRREIRVMRYVGATNWYIRLPFLLEGVFLGCIGALVAVLIIRSGYYYLMGYVTNVVSLPMGSDLVDPTVLMGPILIFCLIYVVIIGAFGSLFSIRKFLDA